MKLLLVSMLLLAACSMLVVWVSTTVVGLENPTTPISEPVGAALETRECAVCVTSGNSDSDSGGHDTNATIVSVTCRWRGSGCGGGFGEQDQALPSSGLVIFGE